MIFFKVNKRKKLQKAYEKAMKEAQEAQRSGNIQKLAEVSD